MSKRPPNPCLIKINRDYLVAELPPLLGVHKNTIGNWIKDGLPTVDARKPTMIRGVDLREFLTARRQARKRTCPPGHLYCMRCGLPKAPDPELVDYVSSGGMPGNLRGICPDCAALMHRRVSARQLAEHWGHLRMTPPQAK